MTLANGDEWDVIRYQATLSAVSVVDSASDNGGREQLRPIHGQRQSKSKQAGTRLMG